MTSNQETIVDNISKDEDLDVRYDTFGSSSKELSQNALETPFELLNNEELIESGKDLVDGSVYLTNYRIFFLTEQSSFCLFINCPLRLIESVESKENNCLLLNCKDIRSYRLSFLTAERSNFWLKKMTEPTNSFNNAEEIFAFQTSTSKLENLVSNVDQDLLFKDYQRLKLDQTPWRITEINRDYKVCPSYPELCCVPENSTDDDILSVARFRFYRRFPSVVWRHENGAVIVRTSQPEVGWLFWRSKEDEKMIETIINACSTQTTGESQPSENQSNRLLIIDARSYAAALANRAKGGGFEYPPYYSNCDVQFMSLPNIHAVRRSSQMLRSAISSPGQSETWLSQLEASRWLHNLSALLQTALLVVDQIDKYARPVLIHCSDGWDRTPQIISLAEIMLDPYYRTIDGLKTLIEREWIQHGHKFADRCGHSIGFNDPNDRSPIFLQWLDCVYQLYHKDSVAFQFNEMLLLKLAQHTYTCLYGTFLCNNDVERKGISISTRTESIWNFIDSHRDSFLNYHYNNARTDVLRPSCGFRELTIWSNLYLHDINQTPTCVPVESPSLSIPLHCKSYEDLGFSMSNGLHSTTSDPNLTTSTHFDTNSFSNGRFPPLFTCNIPNTTSRLRRSLSTDSSLNSHRLVSNHLNSQQHFRIGSHRTSIRERTPLPLSSGSDNQMKERHSFTDDSSLARQLALAVQRSPLNSHDVDSFLRNLTFIKRHTNSMSSTGSSLSEDWSLARTNSLDPSQSLRNMQSFDYSRIVRCIRKKIDKDGLTKFMDPTRNRMIERETENSQRRENLHRHMQIMQRFIDLIPHTGYQSTLPSIECSTPNNVNGLDSSSSSSWQKIDMKELTVRRWVPDSSAVHCRLCNVKFIKWPMSRKHHCRECGEVFCGTCSNFNKFLPSTGSETQVRVCRTCFLLSDERKSNSKTNMMIESTRPPSSCPIAIPTGCHQANSGQSPSFTAAGGQKVKG